MTRHFTMLTMAVAILAGTLQATAQTVTTSVMDATTEGSLLKIIADAPAGSHVDIHFNFDGSELVYNGTSAINMDGKDITIDGLNQHNGQKVTLTSPIRNVDGQSVGSSMFKVGDGAKLTLKNLQLTGCRKIALFCEKSGVLNISGCLFNDNKDIKAESGNNGGVLRQSGGTVTIEKTVFDGNEGNGSYGGGAICVYNTADMPCSLTVRGCTFHYNQGVNGGAIAVNVRDNNCVPTVHIENCTFANNYVANRGGAIYMQDSHKAAKNVAAFAPVLVNNTFVGNVTGITTSDDGGAINFWARATAVPMEPVLFNNLFAANYYDPWGANRLNDIKCFYFAGDMSGGNEQPQTVKPHVANNILGAPEDKFFTLYGNTDDNGQADFNNDDIFLGKEMSPIEEGDPDGTHYTATLYTDLKVAALSPHSVAIGKGVAAFAGVSAPLTDQLGNVRPATPSVGAAEYTATPSGIKASTSTSVNLTMSQGAIMASGFEGNASLDIVNVAGQWVRGCTVCGGQQVRTDALPAGVYVARVKGRGLKFVK